jgi:hypothetical protein
MWLLILFIVIFFIILSRYGLLESFEKFRPWPTRITRPTRNMSYDIRGEECYPRRLNLPFNNSSIEPIPQPILIDRK